MKKLVLVLLLIAIPCGAQEIKHLPKRRPLRDKTEMLDVPKRKVFDKKFWLATLVVVGSTVLDVESTARCLRRPGCAEGNSIYGRHPSRGRLYGIKGPLAAFTIWSTWWWKRDYERTLDRWERRLDPETPEPRVWEKPRARWYIPTLVVSGVNGAAGAYNLTRMPKNVPSPPVQPAKLSSSGSQQ